MYIVVLITASSKEEAEKISKSLLEERLCACINIVDRIDSLFWWKDKLERASESLLIVKTKKSLIPKLVKRIKSLHSYEVPEIIALPIIAGNKDYLDWLNAVTR